MGGDRKLSRARGLPARRANAMNPAALNTEQDVLKLAFALEEIAAPALALSIGWKATALPLDASLMSDQTGRFTWRWPCRG